MSSAEAFPLFVPADVRRMFESDEATRRIARLAELDNASRVLELGCGRGTASVLFAKEVGCEVVAADSDEHGLRQLAERVRIASLSDRVSVRTLDFQQLPFTEGEFDGVVMQGRVLFPLRSAVEKLRPMLGPQGRLVLTYPVRVGRLTPKPLLDFWEKRLGEALLLPRGVLLEMERGGFEPESIETLSDPELAEYYRTVEAHLSGTSKADEDITRQEIALFRAAGGKSTVTYAQAIGRRKEPNEKPPVSRDRG